MKCPIRIINSIVPAGLRGEYWETDCLTISYRRLPNTADMIWQTIIMRWLMRKPVPGLR